MQFLFQHKIINILDNCDEKELVNNKNLQDKHMGDVFIRLYKFLKLYNNNYRPIYHLESFIFYLCIKIHEL